MTLTIEQASAKVRDRFVQEWKGGMWHINAIAKILGDYDYSMALEVMDALGSTPDFTYDVRHTCPEGHRCEPDGYCDECGLTYLVDEIEIMRYLAPTPESGIKPRLFPVSDEAKYAEAVRAVLPDLTFKQALDVAEAVIEAYQS